MYASLEPATAWAEWNAATSGAIDPTSERRRLWTVDIRGLPVVDLRRPETVRELDVRLEDLTGPRARAHGLAARARKLGAQGMIVPSAARDGAWNLVVFPSGFDRLRTTGSRVMHPRPPAAAVRS